MHNLIFVTTLIAYFRNNPSRTCWLFFTIIVGCLPMLLRYIVFLCVPTVTPFIVSDLIFLGILFNVSTVMSISAVKELTTIRGVFLGWAVFTSIMLLCLYVVSMLSGANALLLTV